MPAIIIYSLYIISKAKERNKELLTVFLTFNQGNPSPLSYCYYDLAESVEARLEGLFVRVSSIFLADIAFQNLDKLDDLEVFLLVLISSCSIAPFPGTALSNFQS